MNNQNRFVYFLIVILTIVAVGACLSLGFDKNKAAEVKTQPKNKMYTFAELGFPEVSLQECDVFKNQNANYPISVSFTVKDVSGARNKIKDLALKYNAQVTYDSLSSYPGNSSGQDSASLTFLIKDSLDKFNLDLNVLIKSLGGETTSYSYQTNVGYGTTPYTTCQSSFQNVLTDKTQLEVLTSAMLQENNPQTLSILSQSVSTTKNNLQNDINSFEESNRTASQPAVSVSITSPYGDSTSGRGE